MKKKSWVLIPALFLTMAISACGGRRTNPTTTSSGTPTPTASQPATPTGSQTVPVTAVVLDKTSAELEIGEKLTLKATVAPKSATNQKVTWSSSNTNVATVEGGVVTAKAAGQAVITVKTEDGGKTATCTVTVKKAAQPTPTPTPSGQPATPTPSTQPAPTPSEPTTPVDPTEPVTDAKYSILLGGHAYDTVHNDAALDPEYDEYMALGIAANAGDELQVRDNESEGYPVWTIGILNPASSGFEMQDGKMVCIEDGTYDFYLKFKYKADEIYIGKSGGSDPTAPVDPTEPVTDVKYSILLGGQAYDTVHNDAALDPEYDEYMALGIAASEGDELQVRDNLSEGTPVWTIAILNPASSGFEMQDGKMVCIESGTYDFYLKFKYEADEVYIGRAA